MLFMHTHTGLKWIACFANVVLVAACMDMLLLGHIMFQYNVLWYQFSNGVFWYTLYMFKYVILIFATKWHIYDVFFFMYSDIYLKITYSSWNLFKYDIFWYLFQYLQQFGGYGACIVIGFLFMFIFPLIGLCFCCCRCCCSNCGGKMMQHHEDVKADCKRRTFAIILFVLIAFTG